MDRRLKEKDNRKEGQGQRRMVQGEGLRLKASEAHNIL